jgi:hypothetical protein
MMVNDNLCIRDSSIFWDATDFSMGKIENCVCANSDTFFSLEEGMQFFRHSRNPQVFQSWVVHELFVLGDCFFCDQMDNAIADLFNVDVMLKPVY